MLFRNFRPGQKHQPIPFPQTPVFFQQRHDKLQNFVRLSHLGRYFDGNHAPGKAHPAEGFFAVGEAEDGDAGTVLG